MTEVINTTILSALTPADLNTTISAEPRIPDLKLAEALGFGRPRDIRQLIERHREALERLGGICGTVPQIRGRGRPSSEFWLTKKQALFVCTKSETERATDITIMVVEVFDAATSNTTPSVQASLSLEPPQSSALASSARGLTTAQVLHPALLAQIEERARELAEASIPRLQDELAHRIVHYFTTGWFVDLKNEHFRVSTLRRYKPGSEDEARFQIDTWAWEMVPDISNVTMREALKAAITPILRGGKAVAKQ